MNFWGTVDKVSCFPNCGCEFVDVNHFITQPFAAWSSFFYWIAAFYILKKHYRNREVFHLWTGLLIVLGISSFLVHASWTRWAGAMDFASIATILSFFVFLRFIHSRRALWLSLYFILLCVLFYFLSGWLRISLASSIFLGTLWELRERFGVKVLSDSYVLKLIALLLFSFCFFVLDELRILCDPQGFIHGHTIWHLGGAMTIALYGDWRFKKPKITES
jgi:hypothetical protein